MKHLFLFIVSSFFLFSCASDETDSLTPSLTSLSTSITLHDDGDEPESAIHVLIDDTKFADKDEITVFVDSLTNTRVEIYYDVNNDSTVNRNYRVYSDPVEKTKNDYFFVKVLFFKDNNYHVIESYAIKDHSVSYRAIRNDNN
ncbi:hypothetical protein MY04_5456 [Flammeovirga sp. MY04]|uniref:hypothetical protein n=1 Tax=Flammeovirga sp. MY04 TaxID=1191459 RepID=UPI0008060D89|nr:hypothetical protein [Flammeovirga sp. MY04]ANQ52787.1 hypothetical protein MY04_5456 [Flammeovirga sp. MY04]